MDATPQQCFRIDPSLRRCCWYVILSVPLLCGVAFWVGVFVQKQDPSKIALVCAMFALIGLAMIPPLRWKLWIRKDGIERRFLFRAALWTWDDLANRRIRKAYCTLVDPERPWWCRRLSLGGLAQKDFRQVIAEINKHYKLPPPPEVPDTLKIRYGLRCTVTFDHKGIHLLQKNTPKEYLWQEIQQVHITAVDSLRHDFVNLVIKLPDQGIELTLFPNQDRTGKSWRGATSEQIREYLRLQLPPERFQTSIAGEPPKTREHIQKKLDSALKSRRELAIFAGIFFPIFAGLLVWMAIDDGIFMAAMMAGMCAMPAFPVFLLIYRDFYKRVNSLKKELDSLTEVDEPPYHGSQAKSETLPHWNPTGTNTGSATEEAG